MTPETIARLRHSWASLAPADGLARRFYEILFELDPSLRPLFAGTTMAAQEAKFTATLGTLVLALEEEEDMVTSLAQLGRRHAGYAVKPAHYRTVGQALIATLADARGSDWTPAERTAWLELYETAAATMQRAVAT